jgi:hypothetical protein
VGVDSGPPQVGDLTERRRDGAAVPDLAGPTTSTLHPADHDGSTSSTSKATTVLADAAWRLVPAPALKTIWPSHSR